MNLQERSSYYGGNEVVGRQTSQRTRSRPQEHNINMGMGHNSRTTTRLPNERTIARSASSHSHSQLNTATSGDGELVLDAVRRNAHQPQLSSIRNNNNNHLYPYNVDSSPTKKRSSSRSRQLWQRRRRERETRDRDEKMTLRRLPSEVSASSSSQMSAASTLVSRFLPSKSPFEAASRMQNENAPPSDETQTQQQTDKQQLTAVDFARNAPQAGYLFKKGARIAEYKRRFFVLQPSTYLYYFLSETDTVPRGCVDIEKECVEFVMKDEFPDGRCRFELHLGGEDTGNEQSQTLCLEARSPEICREWENALQSYKFSNLQAKTSGLEQECNTLQTRLHEMERTLEGYRLVEKDRDGALQEARTWKHKYRDLDSALAVLTRVLSNRQTTSVSTDIQFDPSEKVAPAEKCESENDKFSTDQNSIHSMPLHASSFDERDEGKNVPTIARENRLEPDPQQIFESDTFSQSGSPKKDTSSPNKPSNELLSSLADQLLSKDQQLLGSIVLPDSNFGALSNACQMVKENLGLMVQETEHLQHDMELVVKERQHLSKKMQKAEKLITKLWEENCNLRESTTKLRKERKVLSKEVSRLSAKEHDPSNQTKSKCLGSPEKRLLQELERDLEALSCKYRGGGMTTGRMNNLQVRSKTSQSNALTLPMQAVTLPTLHHQGDGSARNTISSDSQSVSTTATSLGPSQVAIDGRHNERTLVVKNSVNAIQIEQIRHSNSLLNDEDDDSEEEEFYRSNQQAEKEENEKAPSPEAPQNPLREDTSTSRQSGIRSPLHPRALSLDDVSVSQDHDVQSIDEKSKVDERIKLDEIPSLHAETQSLSGLLGRRPQKDTQVEAKRKEQSIFDHNQVIQNALDFLEPETLHKSCDSSHNEMTKGSNAESDRMAKDVLELLEPEASCESSYSTGGGMMTDEKTETTEDLTCISLKDHSRATSRFECPLSKPSSQHNHFATTSSTEQASTHMDGRVYHLTFYSRKIGIQFQKVPAPVRRHGRLTHVISPESTISSQETSTKLKSVAWLNEQLRKGRGETQSKNEDDVDSLCHVASPQDAVVVCGLQGFDDGANHVRPRIGARLVAFDGISLEVGQWTFEAVRQGIQARDRPLTLSFRNDRLDQAQLALLSQGVAELGGPEEYMNPPIVSQEYKLQPLSEDWFHGASGPSPSFWQAATASNHGSQSRQSLSSLSTDIHSQRGLHNQGHQTPDDIEEAYYESFNEDGGSTVFPSAVPPLVANIFSGLVSRERGTNQHNYHRQPHYLRRDQSSQHSDEGFRQTLHEFEAGLL